MMDSWKEASDAIYAKWKIRHEGVCRDRYIDLAFLKHQPLTTMPFTDAVKTLQKLADETFNAAVLEYGEKCKVPNDVRSQVNSMLNAATFLRTSNIGGMGAVISILRSNAMKRLQDFPDSIANRIQHLEVMQSELKSALHHENQQLAVAAIGDLAVSLMLAAKLAGTTFENCLLALLEEECKSSPSHRS